VTLDEIRASVLADLGDPDGDIWTNENGNPRLDRLIDRAYDKLINAAIAVDGQFLQTSQDYDNGNGGYEGADAVVSLALPDDFRGPAVLERTDVSPPRPVQIVPRFFFNLYRGIDDGEVAYITHESDHTAGVQKTSGTITVYLPVTDPVTDFTYTLVYNRRPASLIDADSIATAIELPAEFHYLIGFGAVIIGLLQENSDASAFKALYDEGMRELVVTFNRSAGRAVMAG
jgi:hypothetical protein